MESPRLRFNRQFLALTLLDGAPLFVHANSITFFCLVTPHPNVGEYAKPCTALRVDGDGRSEGHQFYVRELPDEIARAFLAVKASGELK